MWPGWSHRARPSCSRLAGDICWDKSCHRCRTPGQRRCTRRTRGGLGPLRQSYTAARHRRSGRASHRLAPRRLRPPQPRTPRSSRTRPSPGHSDRRAAGRDNEQHHKPADKVVFFSSSLHELRKWAGWGKQQTSLWPSVFPHAHGAALYECSALYLLMEFIPLSTTSHTRCVHSLQTWMRASDLNTSSSTLTLGSPPSHNRSYYGMHIRCYTVWEKLYCMLLAMIGVTKCFLLSWADNWRDKRQINAISGGKWHHEACNLLCSAVFQNPNFLKIYLNRIICFWKWTLQLFLWLKHWHLMLQWIWSGLFSPQTSGVCVLLNLVAFYFIMKKQNTWRVKADIQCNLQTLKASVAPLHKSWREEVRLVLRQDLVGTAMLCKGQ